MKMKIHFFLDGLAEGEKLPSRNTPSGISIQIREKLQPILEASKSIAASKCSIIWEIPAFRIFSPQIEMEVNNFGRTILTR